MATSVAQGFNELRDRFPLTQIQSESANTKVANIRDFLNEKFFMAESAITIGSYARGSIIRVERDVDILAPLNYPKYKETYDGDPQAFLYMVRDALNAKFGSTTVSSKKVAVKLDFTAIAIDVVPCFRRQGGGYLMPNGSGDWMSTNPPFHTTLMKAANDQHEAKLIPLVKLMKFWNIANGHHLSSLHIELMTERMWRGVNFGERLYSTLLCETLKAMPGWVGKLFPDPWESGHSIDIGLSADERAKAIRMLNEDAERSRKAEEFRKSGEIKKAYECWAIIFNHQFPTYG